jgi:hypothetical protein
MLQRHNSVAFFYRIRLTSPGFLLSLSTNRARWMSRLASSASGFGAALVCLGVAAGCATLDSRPAAQVVKERAQARWNARVAGDTKAEYGYFSPATRQTLKYEDFASNARVGFWKAVTVDRVECGKPDVCTAHVIIEYEHRGARIKTPLQETWIQEGRDWWFATKD